MRSYPSTRVYLTKAAVAMFEKKPRRFATDKAEVDWFQDYEVRREKTGTPHIMLSEQIDFTDPTAELPNIPSKFIAKVSYRGQIDGTGTFRAEGVYRLGRSTMTLRNRKINEQIGMHGEDRLEQSWQDVSIVASGFKALRQIYTQVRQGRLRPAEDWSLLQHRVAIRWDEEDRAKEKPKAEVQH